MKIIGFVALVFTFTACSSSDKPVTQTRILLGETPCVITLYDKTDDGIFDAAFERIAQIETRMSLNVAGSDVVRVNEAAGSGQWVKVSAETAAVVAEALRFAGLSGGRFDPTVGPLVQLWGIGTDEAAVPADGDRRAALALIGWNSLEVSRETDSVRLAQRGMRIDLGAIAKGWAADEVVRILKDKGVGRAIVDLGGNIYALGTRSGGGPWRIGIQNPETARGDFLGIVTVDNRSVVTSGNYERIFVQDGRTWHHILDTSTGFPVENELASVSIISKRSVEGDALSTSCFALGLEKGLALIKSLADVDAIFVTKDKKVYITAGLKERFTLVNTEYELIQR